MRRAISTTSPIRWPIWLLCVAWFCANSPQTACFEAVAWIKGATNFSHQARLTLSVAQLLGDAADSTPELAFATAEPRPAPLIPAEATIKKIELLAPSAALPVLARARTTRAWPRDMQTPPAVWRETPYLPPRVGA